MWPTIVLAGKLDQALAGSPQASAYAADFHARYVEAGTRLALPAPRSQQRR